MRKYAFVLLALAIPLLILSSTCLGAERRVVIEYFTNTG